MSKLKITLLILGFILFAVSSYYLKGSQQAPEPTAQSRALSSEAPTLKTDDGKFYCQVAFSNGAALKRVEVARTKQEMEQGYQNRTDTDDGMLYVWPDEQYRTFYSRNIIVPIDLVYINSKGLIVGLNQLSIKSDDLVKSNAKAKYVLELSRSMVSLLKLSPGLNINVSGCS